MHSLLAPIDPNRLTNSLEQIGLRLDAGELDRFCASFALTRAATHGLERLDANDTAFFRTQLEYISQRLREIRYPALKWRLFVPVTSEAPAGADTWSYYAWDSAGIAELIANYADDVRRVAVTSTKVTYDILSYALAYDWSVLDVKRASMAGVDYRNRKADAVRRGFEQRFERLAALGEPGSSIRGLLNNANVPVVAAANVGGTTVWGSGTKTPQDVLNDLLAGETAILVATKGVESPDTLLLPLAKLRYIQNTSLYTGAGADPSDTILSVYLERTQYVRNVDWWQYLDLADAAGTGPRAVWYRRDEEHVHFELTEAPNEQAPQQQNFALVVNSMARAGGVAWELPLSGVYMDGI